MTALIASCGTYFGPEAAKSQPGSSKSRVSDTSAGTLTPNAFTGRGLALALLFRIAVSNSWQGIARSEGATLASIFDNCLGVELCRDNAFVGADTGLGVKIDPMGGIDGGRDRKSGFSVAMGPTVGEPGEGAGGIIAAFIRFLGRGNVATGCTTSDRSLYVSTSGMDVVEAGAPLGSACSF